VPTDPLPAISIVTPSLDQGRYIGATIESVLGQGYPELDYFVQDGGSTDETLAILAGYGDRVPHVSEPDRGQADAINRGLSRARGEILAYLNSDDLLLPGALTAVGEAFASDPRLVLVYGRAVYVDAEGRLLGPYMTRPFSREALASFCFIAQPAAFFRRRVWEEIGPFDETLHHTMDYDFWLRLATRYEAGRIRYLDRELAAARLHPDAKTVAGWGRALEEILDLVKRRTGYVSLWWCVAKWDHEIDGRNQVVAPHPVPWRAYPPAIWEFLRRNGMRPALWWRGLKGALPGLMKRISAGARR
jgi:glycosyltransferase involved in cell wall biosynthesis